MKILILSLLLLAGCTDTAQKYADTADAQIVTITITDDLPEGVNGRAECSGRDRIVKVRRSHYPDAIPQEAMRCMEMM